MTAPACTRSAANSLAAAVKRKHDEIRDPPKQAAPLLVQHPIGEAMDPHPLEACDLPELGTISKKGLAARRERRKHARMATRIAQE